jgi:ATP-dependent helicase/DNAse subunit B
MTPSLTIPESLKQEREERSGEIWNWISASRLNLWLRCPRAFYLRYVEGITTPPSSALFIGKVVHTILAHVYTLQSVGQVCDEENISQLVNDAWGLNTEMEACEFKDTADEEKCKSQVHDLVAAYMTATPIHEEKPVAIEKRYEVPLIDPFTGEDLGIPLVGVLDLVLQDDAGSRIIDFKTSSAYSMPELQNETQLNTYAYLFREATGQDESCCEIRQLTKGKTPRIATHTYSKRSESHFSRYFSLVREYLDALDKGVFNYRPSWTCSNFCDHNGTCC